MQRLREYVTHTCPSMANWTTTDQYNAMVQQVQGTNELLYEAAQDANNSFSNLQVAFSNRLFDLDIAPSNLAVDCFHPNGATQGTIAQELWADQPWYK